MYTHIAYENRKQNTTLFTPSLHVQSVACLSFYVFFYGDTDAFLTLHAIGQSTNQSQQLLRLSSGSSAWARVEAELSGWMEQVAFVVNAQVRTEGGIGVDDVSIINSRCEGKQTGPRPTHLLFQHNWCYRVSVPLILSLGVFHPDVARTEQQQLH